MKENSSTSTRNNISVLITVAIGLVALVLLSCTSTKKEAAGGSINVGDTFQSKTASVSSSSAAVFFQEGSVGAGGVPYLRCGVAPLSSQTVELVMLHGSRFTKEDWRTSGILQKLCAIPNFSVTALDLDKSAGHDELKQVLLAMAKGSLINKLPAAVVTPSASGKVIVDWLDDIPELKQYIGKWIPVAPPAVGKANEEQLKQLAGLPILAIYGTKDTGGKVVSEKLGQLSQAKVIEIPGSHPCYLDSPDEFIQHVRAFLE